MKLLGLAMAAMATLAACVLPTAKDKYGKGPLPNRAMVATYYAQYLEKASPQYFFVANDGSNIGYSYCEGSSCYGNEMQVAEESCRARSRGAACSIYAKNRMVVWDETVPATKAALAPRTPSNPASVATARTEPATITRPVAVRWEGYPSLIAGMISIQPQTDKGDMTITLPNNDGKCSGTYQGREQGTWSLACTNNLAASGTFKILGREAGSTGTGRDTKGRSVEFTVGGAN